MKRLFLIAALCLIGHSAFAATTGTTIAVLTVGDDGTSITTTAVDTTSGNVFINDGKTYLWVTNGHQSGSTTVTFTTDITIGGLTVEDPTVTVAAGITKVIGPFPKSTYDIKSGTYRGYVKAAFTGTGASATTIKPFK